MSEDSAEEQMDENNIAFFSYTNLETLRVEPDDMRRAVEVFQSKFGQRPLAIGLPENCDPQIAAMAGEMGILVHHPRGMLAHEIWLSPRENFVTQSSSMSPLQVQIGRERNKSQARPLIPLGRRPIELPLEKVLALRNQGFGARAIARKLQEDGLTLSHMTVYRAFAKVDRGKGRRSGESLS